MTTRSDLKFSLFFFFFFFSVCLFVLFLFVLFSLIVKHKLDNAEASISIFLPEKMAGLFL